MTFCLAMEVDEGVVALADTRIVRGSEHAQRQKIGTIIHGGRTLFTMTSGLRSVRDKTHYYLEEQLQSNPPEMTRLWQFANLFGEQLRRVRNEDAASLAATGHSFNLHAIIGGRLSDDERPRLIYVYPEGNWVSATEDAPYFLIGRTYYGKPILDRLLHARTPLRTAITLAVLAFDATRTSITDVGCPVDLLVLPNGTSVPAIVRLDEAELAETTNWWEHHLRESLAEIPVAWMDKLLSQEP